MTRRGGVTLVECVDRLAGLLGVSGRQAGEFDWAAVEASVGLSLPTDYKTLVETFPLGRFQGFIGLIRPQASEEGKQEFLGYYSHRLEDMRSWREDEPDRFPLPIFPEPGGLLPWAETHRGDLFFWLTEAQNANTWPIVVSDFEFSFWQHFNGTSCELLTEIVCGRFDAGRFEKDLTGYGPRFEMRPSGPSAATVPPKELHWIEAYRLSERLGGLVSPVNEFPALAELLGTAPPGSQQLVKWPKAEQRLGLQLPADYKAFINTYGAGTYCDITIGAPGASGEFDLFALVERKHAEGLVDVNAPIYPEPGGLVPWGETSDGWGCFWAATDPDPDQWGTGIVRPGFTGYSMHWSTSFSSLLLKYQEFLTNPETSGLFPGREAPRVPLEFTPYYAQS